MQPLTHRAVLAIALPVMLSNVSTPLIGVVDTAVVGRIPDPAYIGAVAVGALVFTFVFWAFGFLRMGTTGMTAQALGAGDADELVAGLARALLIALAAGVGLIVLQWPIREAAFGLLEGSAQVESLARDYFDIRIWSAPAALANYALLGWFIGQGRTGIGLLLQLALIFVFVWFMAQGARQGDVVLAANAVLMHFIGVGAYFLDGLAFAAEALVGRAVGAAHRAGLAAAARITTLWALGVAALVSLVLALFGTVFIDLLTVDATARATARTYLPWAAAAPLLGVWAFQLDGIFIGATRTAAMRNAMVVSTGIFLAGWWLLLSWGNHGLWAALYVHYLARIGTLAYCYPALVRSVAPGGGGPAGPRKSES